MHDYDFFQPESLPDTLDLLQRIPDAGIVAGGTDMMVLMKDLLVRPSTLISLSGLKDLKGIHDQKGSECPLICPNKRTAPLFERLGGIPHDGAQHSRRTPFQVYASGL